MRDDGDDDDLVISKKHSRSFGQRAKVPLQRDEEDEEGEEGRRRYYSLVAQNTSIL